MQGALRKDGCLAHHRHGGKKGGFVESNALRAHSDRVRVLSCIRINEFCFYWMSLAGHEVGATGCNEQMHEAPLFSEG